jgi:hypothetical protein
MGQHVLGTVRDLTVDMIEVSKVLAHKAVDHVLVEETPILATHKGWVSGSELRVLRAAIVDGVVVVCFGAGEDVLLYYLRSAATQVEIQDQTSSALLVLANWSMEVEDHLNTLKRG